MDAGSPLKASTMKRVIITCIPLFIVGLICVAAWPLLQTRSSAAAIASVNTIKNELAGIKAVDPANFEMIRRVFYISQISVPPLPLLVDDGRLFLTQPDDSITVLELATGNVLRRIRGYNKTPYLQDNLSFINEFVVQGNVIIGKEDVLSANVLIDRRSCDILHSGIVGPIVQFGKQVVFTLNGEIISLDTETCASTKLRDGKGVAFHAPLFRNGNSLVAFLEYESDYEPGNRPKASQGGLECIDPGSDKLLWRVRADKGKRWVGVAFEDEKIFVFEESLNGSSTTAKSEPIAGISETIAVFSSSGGRLDTLDSTRELVDRLLSGSYGSVWYGTWRNRSPYSASAHDDAPISLSVSLSGSSGMQFRLEEPAPRREENDNRFRLHYSDRVRSWNGVSNCLDDLSAYLKHFPAKQKFFSLAYDDERVLYASATGKVECLARKDGKPLWVYSYPIPLGFYLWGRERSSYLSPSKWRYMGDGYFSEEVAYYQDGLRRVDPAAVDGASPSAEWRIVSDPDLFFDQVTTSWFAWVIWGVPILWLVVLWRCIGYYRGDAFKAKFDSTAKYRVTASCHIAAAVVLFALLNFFHYRSYGRFSPFVLSILAATFVVFFIVACREFFRIRSHNPTDVSRVDPENNPTEQ